MSDVRADAAYALWVKAGDGVADETREGRGLRNGAAEVAPTAPHARPRDPSSPTRPASGPERFWDRRRVRWALLAGVVASIVAHGGLIARSLQTSPDFEIHDFEGELDIPVDLEAEMLAAEKPQPATTEAPSNPSTPSSAGGDLVAADASVPIRDAEVDAFARDGATDGSAEGSSDAAGEAASDAASDAGAPRDGSIDAPLVAMAGSGDAIDALSAGEHAAEQAIVLLVNMGGIRKSTFAPRISALIAHVPQWDTFMLGTNVDPIRDIDWIQINGPSLVDTSKDEILVHYSASDALIDRAIDVIKSHGAGSGPFDAGVPHVKATIATADRAPRVFMRPQRHTLLAVPPSFAGKAARYYAQHAVKAEAPFVSSPDEAVHLTMRHPHTGAPQIPEEIKKLSLAVARREDESAEIALDAECDDEAGAQAALTKLQKLATQFLGSPRGMLANSITGGLLSSVELSSAGSRVRIHVIASKEQIETILSLVDGLLQGR